MFELEGRQGEGAAPPPKDRPQEQERPGLPLELARVRSAFATRRRWVLLFSLLGLGVGAGLGVTVAPREFSVQSTLVWEPEQASAGEDAQRVFRTLTDSIKLASTLRAARERAHRHDELERLARHVEVEASGESRLVNIKATGSTAEEAFQLGDAVVQAFLEQRTQVERARAAEQRQALEQVTEAVRVEYLRLQRELDDFRREHNLVDLTSERASAVELAARLRSEVDVARAGLEGQRARGDALTERLRGLQQTTVLSASEAAVDAQRLAELEAELTSVRGRLTEEHPRVLALRAQVEALRTRVASGARPVTTGRVVGRNPLWDSLQGQLHATEAELQSTQARNQALDALAQQARARAAALSAVEGEAMVKQAAVHTAEHQLSVLEEARREAEVRERRATPGFRVLAPPVRPDRPSKSLRRVFTGAGVALGVLAWVAWVLLAMLRRAKPGSAREAAWWSQRPVVGSTEKGMSAEECLAELDAALGCTHGEVLVLALGEEAARYLQSLARTGKERKGGTGDKVVLQGGTTLVRPSSELVGRALRRAVRAAERVLVVLPADAVKPTQIADKLEELGCPEGRTALWLVEVGPLLAKTPDRAGSAPSWCHEVPREKARVEVRPSKKAGKR